MANQNVGYGGTFAQPYYGSFSLWLTPGSTGNLRMMSMPGRLLLERIAHNVMIRVGGLKPGIFKVNLDNMLCILSNELDEFI